MGMGPLVSCWEFAAGRVFVDCRKSVCCRSPVRDRAFVGCRELVGRAFVNSRVVVACLSLVIAFLVKVLRIHRLYLECESVVGGMLTAGNSSQDDLTIKVSDFRLISSGLLWCNGGMILYISIYSSTCSIRDP